VNDVSRGKFDAADDLNEWIWETPDHTTLATMERQYLTMKLTWQGVIWQYTQHSLTLGTGVPDICIFGLGGRDLEGY
jgi:hypothetical protein